MIAYFDTATRVLWIVGDDGRQYAADDYVERHASLAEVLLSHHAVVVEPWRDVMGTGTWMARVEKLETADQQALEADATQPPAATASPHEDVSPTRPPAPSGGWFTSEAIAELMVAFAGALASGQHRLNPRAAAVDLLRANGHELPTPPARSLGCSFDELPIAVHDESCRTWQRRVPGDPHAPWRLLERRADRVNGVATDLTGWTLVNSHNLHIHEPGGDVTRLIVVDAVDELRELSDALAARGQELSS